MRHKKWLVSFVSFLAVLLLLMACETGLEKPTGLEDQTSEQTVEDDSSEADVKERTSSEAEDENKKTSDVEIGLTDEEAQKDKETSTNERDVANSSGPDETNDQSSTASKSSPTDKNNRSTEQKGDTKKDQDSKSANSRGSSSSISDSSTNKDGKKSTDSTKKKDGKKETSPPAKPKNTITITIVISDSEVPLPATEMEIKDGVSALDALIDVTMKHGVHLDYRGGTGAGGYVQGLGNVYEFDRGPGSGWMFRVNGIFPNRGAGVTPLLGGDHVEWLYTENLGEDLGADLQPFR